MMTPPHPSSSALPTTFAFVPGGPEPMIKGLGSRMPSTVVSSVAMGYISRERIRLKWRVGGGDRESCHPPAFRGARPAHHQRGVNRERNRERHEPCVGVELVEEAVMRAGAEHVDKP